MQISKLTNYSLGYTLNVGIVSGGTAVNTVPDFARGKFDLRFQSKEAYVDAKDKIRKILEGKTYLSGTKISYRESLPTPAMLETEESIKLFEEYSSIGADYELVFQKNTEPAGGSSSANLISDAGVPVLDAIGPLGYGAHSNQERILLKSLKLRTLCLANWLQQQSML